MELENPTLIKILTGVYSLEEGGNLLERSAREHYESCGKQEYRN